MSDGGSKWTKVITYSFGPGSILFYRTKEKSDATEQRKAGYGYFATYRLNNCEPMIDCTLPLKLLPFLMQKEKELTNDFKSPQSITIDPFTYYISFTDDGLIKFAFQKHGSINGATILSLRDLKRLICVLRVLSMLIKTQPDRVDNLSSYFQHAYDLMGWSTALTAYFDCVQELEVGKTFSSLRHFDECWQTVKEKRIARFLDQVEFNCNNVRNQTPIDIPTLTSYQDCYVPLGYTFTTPEENWETNQLYAYMVYCSDKNNSLQLTC